MIEVELPDGTVVEFPDGTPRTTIQAALARYRTRAPASPAAARPMSLGPRAPAETRRPPALGTGSLPALGRVDLPPDPGVVMPALRRAADAAAGWTTGIGERIGAAARANPGIGSFLMGGGFRGDQGFAAIEPGTRREMLGNLEVERDTSLLHGNANVRALALGAAELAGSASGGAIPGLQIGRGVMAATRASRLASPARRALAGAGAATLEGAIQGAGETAGAPLREQVAGVALGAGLAGLAGTGGAVGAILRSRADNVAGRAGRSRPGATQPVFSPHGRATGTRPGQALGGGLPAVATGVGESVPLPAGSVFRGEAAAADVVPLEGGRSHLWGRHYTASRSYAQLHADKYGPGNGRVSEHDPLVRKPFSVERHYTPDELAAIEPEAAARAAALAAQSPGAPGIPGGLMQQAVRNVFVERAVVAGRQLDDTLLAESVEMAGQRFRAAGYDSYHHEVVVPGEGKADSWAVFPDVPELQGPARIRAARDLGANAPPPKPRVSAQVLALYQDERAKAATEVASQVAASQATGQQMSPEAAEGMLSARMRQLDAGWHERLTEAARRLDEPGIHELADKTESGVQMRLEAPPPGSGGDGSSGVIRYGPDPKEPVAVRLRRLWDRWVDEMSNKEEAPVRFLRRAGLDAEAGALEKLIGRARGAGRIAQNTIWRGVYTYDPTTNNVRRIHDSYNSIVGGLDHTAERDLNNLMAAQHHMELVGRRDAARAEAATMDANGIDMAPPDAELRIDERGTAEAQRILADLGRRYGTEADPGTGGQQIAALGGLAQRVRDWSIAAVVEQLDSVGYFRPGAKDAVLAKNREYAPFFRLLDQIAEDPILVGGSTAQPIKRISGGLSPDKPIAPPTESFVAQAQRIASWVERQRVRNLLGDFAEAHPDTIGQEVRRTSSGKGTIQVFRDGERVEYSAPADVVQALERMQPQQASIFMQTAAVFARFLRAGATLTPDFAVRNLLRDQATAGAYGAEFKYRPFADFATGLWAQTPFGGKLRQFVGQWEAAGGALSDYISVERPAAQLTADTAAGLVRLPFLERRISAPRLARTWSEWKSEKGLLAKIAFPVLRPLEGMSTTVEQATRIGAYRRGKLGGASDLDAGFYSRNITLDFGRSGSFGQRWNSVEAFANASLQDVARFSRAMRERPVATSLAAASYITLPALATWAMHKDDPDYQNLPEWERASFLHLTKRDDGRWVRFPRPLGMLNLMYGYGVQEVLEQAIGKGAEEPINDLLATLFNETPLRFSPVQPDPSPAGSIRGSLEAIPSIGQPAIEAAAGPGGWSSFRQGPVVPQGMQEGTLPEDRVLDTTSATARLIGGAVGAAPLKVDHLIRGYGAGLTVAALAVAERAVGAGGTLPDLPTTAKDAPGVGGLISSSPYGFATQPVQDFYALEKAAANAAGSLKHARDAGRAQEYHRILREHPEALLADQLGDVRRQLNELRAARKMYRNAPGMTPEARAEALLQIDQAVTQICAGHMHMASDYLRGVRD